MIIDREAWHMGLCRMTYSQEYEPRNLCKYFWSVVMAVPIFAGKMVVKGIVSGLMKLGDGLEPLIDKLDSDISKNIFAGPFITLIVGLVLFILGMLAYSIFTHPTMWWVYGPLAGVGGIGVFLVLVIGLTSAVFWVNEHRPRLIATVKVVKPPKVKKVRVGDSTWKIVWIFLWAKKKRVCPMIEVRDEARVS